MQTVSEGDTERERGVRERGEGVEMGSWVGGGGGGRNDRGETG